MKVLHVGDIAFVGYTLCQELRDRGVEADLISKKKPLSKQTREQDWITWAKNVREEISLCGLDLSKYDLIHDHYLINLGSLGCKLKNKNVPVLLHCHGSDTRPQSILHKMIQHYVATQSKFLLYSTPDLLDNIKWFEGRTIYSPNPIRISDNQTPTEKYSKRVLIYATLNRVKQIENIFSTIKAVDATFDMIDLGPDRTYYRKLAPSNVQFIEPIAKDNIQSEITKYPLVIGGSQDGSLRMCELESMALGIPTLFPFKYDRFYPDALPMPDRYLENILAHLNDDDLGARQRQWVQTHHDVGTVVNQLMNIYENCLR